METKWDRTQRISKRIERAEFHNEFVLHKKKRRQRTPLHIRQEKNRRWRERAWVI